MSDKSYEFVSQVHLAVVNFSRYQLDDPDDPDQVHLPILALHTTEHIFLCTLKPVHPNIVRYLVVSDNCIYTKLHIGSLERYLTPDKFYSVTLAL